MKLRYTPEYDNNYLKATTPNRQPYIQKQCAGLDFYPKSGSEDTYKGRVEEWMKSHDGGRVFKSGAMMRDRIMEA